MGLSYPIYVGLGIYADPKQLLSHITGKQVFIITQETIAQHYLASLTALFKDYQCDVMLLPEGEQVKNLQQWQAILDTLIAKHHERGTTLIALGGGVVGDITGFAAACYLRGVSYIQIPTTLIAQVDAAIGGKTAINHPHGKNLIGAFHQPSCVIADVSLLQTLPEREYRSGLAEVVKYGLIHDAAFFQWLTDHMDALLLRDPASIVIAVQQSVNIKSYFVAQDEKEKGIRSLLNFGHTFGHALEVANDYAGILHGEAVAIGMSIATRLSNALGLLPESEALRAETLLQKILPLQTIPKIPDPENFIHLMRRDKKVAQGNLHFILLQAIGRAIKTADICEESLKRSLEWYPPRGQAAGG